jgi:hypothetical protein
MVTFFTCGGAKPCPELCGVYCTFIIYVHEFDGVATAIGEVGIS